MNKNILVLLLLLGIFPVLVTGQYFNGVIQQTIEHSSSFTTELLAKISPFDEDEFKFITQEITICKDTLIGVRWGLDSLYTSVYIQIVNENFLYIPDEFVQISGNPALNKKATNQIKSKVDTLILGNKVFQYSFETESSYHSSFISLNHKYQNSFEFGEKYKQIFSDEGGFIMKDIITFESSQSIYTINKIRFEYCSCVEKLDKLSFYTKIKNGEKIDLDKF